MTRSQKLALVALAVVLVVFGLVLMRGSFQKDSCGPADKCADDYKPSPFTEAFGPVLAPLAPKVKLTPERIQMPGTPSPLQVPPADNAFRIARLKLTSGVLARLAYQDLAPDADPKLRSQTLALSAAKPEGSFTATRYGGTLTITCAGACIVQAP